MRCRVKRFLALVSLLSWQAGETAILPAATGIPLRPRVQVRADVIRLSDLLPDTAPAPVQRLAASVILGNAPQSGRHRVIPAELLTRRLHSVPELRSAFQVPAEVVVVRAYRQLTREEVLTGLRSALERSGCTGLLSVGIHDLNVPAPVLVTEANPGVQVMGIESDPFRAQIRFRLRLSNERPSLPFYVTVRRPVDFPGMASPCLTARQKSAEKCFVGENAEESKVCRRLAVSTEPLARQESPKPNRTGKRLNRPERARPPVLVKAGRPATVLAGGPGFRISVPVIPLQRGAQGDEIRVRSVATARVLAATVIAADLLQLTYGTRRMPQ